MTTAAVKKMMLSTFDTALRENDGVITGDEYKKIIDYAKRGWLTSGEKRARTKGMRAGAELQRARGHRGPRDPRASLPASRRRPLRGALHSRVVLPYGR